ncbi:serine hydrolase domain-containing protein [Massilia endophytica]|uniref:serine hydrolase domain-containing protein n=1 Tax=Massilia endophytica TaxID=2899220 RepID=UPI001E58704B|nr:serine hydrolase domain-containing protein [Massilia endophytica]UGQ46717.1 beta-lactamase family protein [Massilia endophytica]
MRTLLSVAALAVSCAMPALAGTPLPYMPPASQGISPDRLHRVDTFVEQAIQRNDYLGAVVLVLRNGKVVDFNAYGHRDLARSEPLQRDAIFRIRSMTKTITAAAILILMEEGKLVLDDPVSKYIPEFADTRVFAGGSAEVPETRPPTRPITIRQLLTHTPGFASYGDRSLPVNRIFDAADLESSPDLDTFVKRLARLPLAHEPGDEFHYDGTATVVAGRIVEVLSGMRFDAFLHKRLFRPLQMPDTCFVVPPSKRARVVDMTTTDASGRLSATAPGTVVEGGARQNPYISGAGGLYSTAGDYARFAQMLLNGGRLDGVQILGRKSVEMMMSNHLTHLNPPVHEYSPAEGFGLGGAVVLDVARRGRLGSVGQFGWSGSASTYYTIDPKEKLVALLMMQHLPQGLGNDPVKLNVKFFNLVYQSLIK